MIGLCADNTPAIANYVNSAQRRLLYCKEVGEEGWIGTYAEIAFEVSRSEPYITLDREIARLEMLNICDWPVPVNNQFFEYLRFGNGRMPKQCLPCNQWYLPQAFTRNNAVTFRDLSSPPQIIRIYPSDPDDADGLTRVFLQGLDANKKPIWTQDGNTQVQGIFVNVETPFVDCPIQMSRITGIQKDDTYGQIRYVQVDPTTAVEIDLLMMQPNELVAGYRRYYLHSLPNWCCLRTSTGCPPNVPQPITVRAIAKLELIPVAVDTDYCLIQNLEAIIEECQSVRYSEMDTPQAKQMAAERHIQAVRLLNGELAHFLGLQQPAMQFRPFGSARLVRQRVGTLV